jgi:hypothetical protein
LRDLDVIREWRKQLKGARIEAEEKYINACRMRM